MLSRCSHCDRPFVVADAKERPRCPHCGRDSDEAPSETFLEPASAVVAEGSKPNEPAGGADQRRHALPPLPPRFVDGRPAWEQRERSLPARFFGTLADVCLRPMSFFTHLSREGVRGITWFGYACLLLGTVGQAFWGIVTLPVVRAMMTQAKGGLSQRDLEAARAEDNAVLDLLLKALQSGDDIVSRLSLVEAHLWATLVLAPVTAFFTIHLLAGLVHFSVQSFRPPAEEPVPYDVTYRFLLYAYAPMVLAVIPTVGALAGPFSFVLMFIAMSRLHRVRVLGLIGGVLFPILLLSWLWDQEALPRIAPPLTKALGVVVAEPEPRADAASSEPKSDDEEKSDYPPMPAADRDHSVEVFEKSGWLFSERTWSSSAGRLHIRQLAAKDAGKDGSRALVIEVENQGEQDIGRFFVRHALPESARLSPSDGAVRAAINALGQDTSDIFIETVLDEREVTAYFARLPRGTTAVVAMKAEGASARALLETAPAVGRDSVTPPASGTSAEPSPAAAPVERAP